MLDPETNSHVAMLLRASGRGWHCKHMQHMTVKRHLQNESVEFGLATDRGPSASIIVEWGEYKTGTYDFERHTGGEVNDMYPVLTLLENKGGRLVPEEVDVIFPPRYGHRPRQTPRTPPDSPPAAPPRKRRVQPTLAPSPAPLPTPDVPPVTPPQLTGTETDSAASNFV